jgi:ketosteroid isomerase-like protein
MFKRTNAGEFGETQRAIQQVLSDSVDYWNRADLDRFMLAYDDGPETIYVGGGEVVKGHAKIHALYARRFASANSVTLGKLTIAVLDTKALGRDYALVTGRYELARGDSTTIGICTIAFHRTRGAWRIVSDHS